jgi:hypothetical protein
MMLSYLSPKLSASYSPIAYAVLLTQQMMMIYERNVGDLAMHKRKRKRAVIKVEKVQDFCVYA